MNLTKYAATALLVTAATLGFQRPARAADTNAPTDSLATERLTAMHERMEARAK